ncbi:GLUG motif-containing protein, partial [Sedimentisphaera salicampi]|uniref:GLUG motif-containing protein n=1 Tax=Sedimentisphaera salicampi TaxID=1941349 RepID=UPI00195EFD55
SCYATGNVSGGYNSEYLGGLCGFNYDGTITNCYATGSVSGGWYLGGVCGENEFGTITNCYATGSVSGGLYLGGLCGWNSGTISSCFWDTETTEMDNSAGGRPKTTAQMKSASTFAGWNDGSWTIDEGNDYPRLAWENDGGSVITTDYPARTYSGEGTQENPFEISDSQDLVCLSNRLPDWDKYFALINDIDMVGEIYYPITTFSGSFDGSGFKIFNLEINGEDIGLRSQLGLFGFINGGEVRNLGIENAQITGSDNSRYLGGLCGFNSDGTIENCYATGDVSGDNYLGGLCGENGGTIENCYATGYVSGGYRSGYLGGLCGRNYEGTIENCYATGSVSGGNYSWDLGG